MIDLNASFLVQLVLFWFVIIILNNMFFKPMLKYLDYRKSLISGRKGESEKVLKDIEEQEKYYNSRLKEAKERGIEFKKTLRQETLKSMKDRFDSELRKLEEEFTKKRNALLGEVAATNKELDKVASDLGRTMATKILGREV